MIPLRKINTLLVITVIILMLNHALLALLSMYGFISYSPDITITGRRLFYPLVGHIIISLYLYFSDKIRQKRTYSKLISDTKQQIVTGILIILFASLHILSHMISLKTNYGFLINVIHFTIDTLLLISIALHLRVSLPRFFISLGLLDGKNSYRNFKEKINIGILFFLILFVIAEIIFYIGGIL